jgi:TonB family protein
MAGRSVEFSTDQNITILITDELPVPVTYGLFRPRILLPAAASNWPEARLKAILVHEMAHVNRRDLLVQFGVHLITALWWFQPLAWLLRKRLRQESELACDAQAIESGLLPTDYASELVALAKAMGRVATAPGPAIAMFGSCDLEERVRAVLNPPKKKLRTPGIIALGMLLGGAAVAAATVTVASNSGGSIMKHTILSALLTSAALSGATVSGSIYDGGSAAVAEAKITLLNPDTSARQEVVSDSSGKFSFSGSGAGQYILRIEKPGFTSILREFDLQGDSAFDADFTLTAPGEKQPAESRPSNAPVNGQPPRIVRIGGGVAQSNLVTKIQPVYPAAAKAAGIQGTVELRATISKDGVPLDLMVISSPSDDLSQSALEAVRQWRYRSTLLNRNPVEISTVIIVNYTLSK